MTHRVSIIIPAYNEENYLPLLLDSISKLDWPKEKLEVIVVDNGSTDNTCGIAESYGTLLLQDSTKNVSGLRNLGAKHAAGDILAFVDADCVLAKDWLKKAEKYFLASNVLAWGGPPVPPESASWVQKAWFLMVANPDSPKEVDWIGTVDFFVKRSWFERIGGFNEKLKTCEDVDFCYQLGKYGKIISDPEIKVVHLREADTIKEFFLKEAWRGSSNLKGIKSHGLFIKELPSILVPFYFGFFFPIALVITFFNLNAFSSALLLSYLFLPGIMAMIKIRRIKTVFSLKTQLIVLTYIYFAARTYALYSNKR